MKKAYFYLTLSFLIIATALFAQPTITSFTPVSGPIGTTVTISGTNFNSTPANNSIFFGGVRATVTGGTSNSLTVTVPTGMAYQPISVTTGNLTAYSRIPFTVTSSCAGGITTNSFMAKTDVKTEFNPYAIATGDFDADGKPDLVAISHSYNKISVFKNTSINTSGLITLSPRVDYPTGTSPWGVAIADMDGDGKLDIVTVNGGNTISVLRNTSTAGTISFATNVDFTAGSFPICIGISDLNGDGKLDIVTGNTNFLSVFLNKSIPGSITVTSFAAKADFPTGSSPTSISIIDLDGDAKPDIASTSGNSATVAILKNKSTIDTLSFSTMIEFPVGAAPRGIAIGDLDGDGNVDIATANLSSASVSILKNTSSNGTITFAAKVDYPSGNGPIHIMMHDLDQDGMLDLAVANNSSNTISLFKNTSSTNSISFSPKVDFETGEKPRWTSVNDIDGDGRPDLAVANDIGAILSVYRNIVSASYMTNQSAATICSDSTLSIPLTSSQPSTYTWVATDNTNVSGETTTIQTTSTLTNKLTNNSPLTQAVTYTVVPTSTTGCGVGTPQILTVNVNKTPIMTSINSIEVCSGCKVSIPLTSNISSTYAWIATDNPNTTGESLTLQTTDTLSNTILKNSAGPEPVLYTVTPTSTLGCGSGTPQTVTVYVTNLPVIASFNPESASIGATVTINGLNFSSNASENIVYFGAVKAVVSAATENTLTVIVPPGTTYQPISVTRGNLTGYSSKPFHVISPCGGVIEFAPKKDFYVGSYPHSLRLADFDGDGKSDLVSTISNGYGKIAIFRNVSTIGNFSLASRVDYVTGDGVGRISISDFNGDGKLDIFATTNQDSTIYVLKNTSTPGSISFAPKLIFKMSKNPIAIESSDLDADGKPELIVLNSDTRDISIFKNTSSGGNISFAPKVDFTNFYYFSPYFNGLSVGDLNGDSKPDLVMINGINNGISILKNTTVNGSISFAVQADYAAGERPSDVTMGDLDGDGKPDLAVTNYDFNSRSVSIYKNTTTSTGGAISFATKVDYPIFNNVSSVKMGDLDGNGKLDLAITVSGGAICILSNTSTPGTISFLPKKDYFVGAYAGEVSIGDIDGDTKPDMVNANSDTLSIFRNVGGRPVMTTPNVVSLCNGDDLAIPLTSTPNCTYTWIAKDNPNTNGESLTTQTTDAIKDPIRNNSPSSADELITYSVIPVSTIGCGAGDAKSITVALKDCYVWPGDADHNKKVDHNDLLAIGLYYYETGFIRTPISNDWQAFESLNWDTLQTNKADLKHVDCNGNGEISLDDTLAINLNFDLEHSFAPIQQERFVAPDLYVVTNSTSYHSGDWVNAEIWAGSSAQPVTNLYGVSFTINYTPSLVESATESLTYPATWFGNPGVNAIKIAKVDAASSTVYGAETRIDRVNVNGYGKIANFKFQLKNSIPTNTKLFFSFLDYKANDSKGNATLFNIKPDSITINPTVGIKEMINGVDMIISPNPFSLQTTVFFQKEVRNTIVKMINVLGKEVRKFNFSGDQFSIEKGELNPGIYFIQVISEDRLIANQKIVIQ